MPTYDVHSFRQIRVKACGIVADSPEKAIAKLEEDAAFDADIRRLVNVEGANGPVVDVEYQDGGIPVGWLVDPLDENEDGHGDGISYDVDDDAIPIRAHDASRMPSDIQRKVLSSFEVQNADVASYDDARNMAKRLVKIDPLAAAMFRLLDGLDADQADAALDDAIARIQALRAKVSQESDRANPDVPPGVDAVLSPCGLTATFVESEDDQCDDEIEIRKPGIEEPIGSIQICGDNDFMAAVWTSPAMDARRHGGFRRTAAAAAADAVAMLKRDAWI